MIIYADITFLNNFLMTLAIIWAVAHLLEFDYKWIKLILAAFVGTIYTFIVLLLQLYNLAPYFNMLLHLSLNIIAALLMIKISFGKICRKNYWKGVLYLYLISFITIGTALSIFYINGGTPFKEGREILFIIICLVVIIIIKEYGWKIVQRYIKPEQFCLPITIYLENIKIDLIGLVDTGNNLTDPLTKTPVIVVSLFDIMPVLDKKLQENLKKYWQDEIHLINVFTQQGWGKRVRILPFSGIGQEHGILIGLRLDKIIIKYKGKMVENKKVIMALSKHKLNDENEYQVLIHPQIIKLQV